jgi:hypothetical protein
VVDDAARFAAVHSLPAQAARETWPWARFETFFRIRHGIADVPKKPTQKTSAGGLDRLNFGIRGRCIARAGPPEWLGESDWTNDFVCTPKKNSPRKAG